MEWFPWHSTIRGNMKTQTNVGDKWVESAKNRETKLDRIKSKTVRESCGIKPIN